MGGNLLVSAVGELLALNQEHKRRLKVPVFPLDPLAHGVEQWLIRWLDCSAKGVTCEFPAENRKKLGLALFEMLAQSGGAFEG